MSEALFRKVVEMKKLAIDWDESELRYVLGQMKNTSLSKVVSAGVVRLDDPEEPMDIQTAFRKLQKRLGIENIATLVAIGRGRAELRNLQLPPVPEDELPDMVQMQAMRAFASAGDNAAIDFLITEQSNEGVNLIAAAVAPNELTEIRHTCSYAAVEVERICLRPLGAVALHQHFASSNHQTKNLVLVDLLANDAEIVITQHGTVKSIRTVRMPSGSSRSRLLTSEIKRSLVSCGEDACPDLLVLWGDAVVHQEDVDSLSKAFEFPVQVIDPFDWTQVDAMAKDEIPDHSGRFAPLIGLLAADLTHPERLIDFLNPRRRYEAPPNRFKKTVLAGIPIAAAALLGFFVFDQFRALDSQIESLKNENSAMQPGVDRALRSISRTEKVDNFLDGDVNWLNELKRLSEEMPSSEDLIVKSINIAADPRAGGGKLSVVGSVKHPKVIDQFENSLRDQHHRVLGDGAKEDTDSKEYRWSFAETINIDPLHVRNVRYENITEAMNAHANSEAGESATENPPPSDEDASAAVGGEVQS